MLFDMAEIAPRDRYKLMVATVVPRPVAWVVTQDAQGGLNAAPYSFFNAVSGDPPIVAVSMAERPEGGLRTAAPTSAPRGSSWCAWWGRRRRRR